VKIVSWNVNGLRAVYKRDFLPWFQQAGADIICLQEIKLQEAQIPTDLVKPAGYHAFFNFASKPGYSGTAVYTKEKPDRIDLKLGHPRFDQEGRFLRLEYPDFSLIALYLPHGGRQKENLPYKLEVYEKLLRYLKPLVKAKTVLIGDFNIAHNEIDLARPKSNLDNIMFTPQERKQVNAIIDLGFTDTFRKFHTDGGHYTWWPYMANARARNLGWRIDYVFTSPSMTPRLKDAFILPDVHGSDHCPVGIRM
jgi:exodeoxyribonuclease-3